MNYEITIFGLLIINLMNWLDGVLTYIGIYILPKGAFYEFNTLALNMFNSIGFFSSFIFKICSCLFITLLIFLMINSSYPAKFKILFNNVLNFYCLIFFITFSKITLEWSFHLINHYV